VLALGIGLTVSGVTHTPVWLIVAGLYLLLEIQAISRVAIGENFFISFSRFGPTEVRLVLIIVNTVAIFLVGENWQFGSKTLGYFDLVGILGAISLCWLFISAFYSTSKKLLDKDGMPFTK
jgi:hypothetical protein